MININYEGQNNIQEDTSNHVNEASFLTLEQEKKLLLLDAQANLAKLEIMKMEIELLDVKDFNTKIKIRKVEVEIEKNKDLVKSLGGEIE